MKHFGDISALSGYELPIVDVITGGSPCQDLSVAGGGEGLSGERSGLFMEQIRLVKEMRERDKADGRTGEFIRPRYMVWENVPGAFGSNGGGDFQTVLTEIARIANEDCPEIPLFGSEENKKWQPNGCVYDDMGEWSLAWRVHNAQFWGVPQRRKRISLVADFGGLSAPEILFERKGMSWYSAENRTERQETSGSVRDNSEKTGTNQDVTLCIGNGQVHDAMRPDTELSKTLNCMDDPMKVMEHNKVRRLTPLECERLQGYPDGWTDIGEWVDTKGKLHKPADSPRYKALGNSIALPFWQFLARRICAQYERNITIGSLFDGISGFPLVFARCGANPVWASEIEEFPIAVCKKHFGNEETGEKGDFWKYIWL